MAVAQGATIRGNMSAAGTSGWLRDIEIVGEGIGLSPVPAGHTTREVGRHGEDLVAWYMEQKGIEILERNWRCHCGEVDIVARDGDTAILLEVKTRNCVDGNDELAPEIAVNSRKRRRYEKLALVYLATKPHIDSVRFDVAAVKLVGRNKAYVRYLAGAYEWDY